MMQTYLFQDAENQLHHKAVNVASVPQRSPFRYPGGKTWFVPRFREWIRSKPTKPTYLVEPFLGGGIISLTAAFEDLVEQVIMVEIDEEVAAVWKCIINGDSEWLANCILNFQINKDNVLKELAKKNSDIKSLAFKTILKNRTFHGGILAAGSGLLKNGENGKGIQSRWYPETLARRLRQIDQIKHKITFIQANAFDILNEYSNQGNVVFFIDPPYTAGGKKAGKRLYTHSELDHQKLFSCCAKLKGDFIMTYDNADEVKDLSNEYGFSSKTIPMKNTHHANMTELVVGRDLMWL
ncbi:MAG: DNA adenine methylase [Candidatus Hinthialibacter antarcticus]|nr:DNA adenine methylase [Candidatus Hinthialibacter antarcticus]